MDGRKGYRQHAKHGKMFMTAAQFRLLDRINSYRLQGDYFVDLSTEHLGTVKALTERGYITPRSAAPDEHVYRMTGLGLDAYTLFKIPRLYRNDGLCPRCGKRPRQQYENRVANYCVECAIEARRVHYKRKAPLRDPNRPCARCGATPRHIMRSAVSSYCIDCYREKARKSRETREQRIRENAAQGNPTLCSVPGCNQPVRISAHSVSTYCQKHDRERSSASKNRQIKRRLEHAYGQLRIVATEYQQAGD